MKTRLPRYFLPAAVLFMLYSASAQTTKSININVSGTSTSSGVLPASGGGSATVNPFGNAAVAVSSMQAVDSNFNPTGPIQATITFAFSRLDSVTATATIANFTDTATVRGIVLDEEENPSPGADLTLVRNPESAPGSMGLGTRLRLCDRYPTGTRWRARGNRARWEGRAFRISRRAIRRFQFPATQKAGRHRSCCHRKSCDRHKTRSACPARSREKRPTLPGCD